MGAIDHICGDFARLMTADTLSKGYGLCESKITPLDWIAIVENYLVVVDDRVPGDSPPEMRLYECVKCHRTEWSEVAPECHGKKMSLIK
jgi:hypothetical protein